MRRTKEDAQHTREVLLDAAEVLFAQRGVSRTSLQEIAKAVREGANAYLSRQFKVIIWLILILAVVLTVTKWPWHEPDNNTEKQIAIGRGIAFLMGSIFSAMVGYFGMSMATIGNLKVATAARARENGFGMALQIGYRSGTVTGMLTDGLGLLGGTLIFLYYGEKAFEVLLGFGFGGTLLALFMRVGGGIYTKAADVGADLVGKIEAGIPEDDPRNAATIADNVGDNVGDCAGMAADIFESYEVTIVAALILGLASFGHMGVIFPLLVHAIGVIGTNWISDGDDPAALGFIKDINVMSVTDKPNPTKEDYYQPFGYNLALKKYPLTRVIKCILKESHMGLGTGFINYMCMDQGQLIVLKGGLLPLTRPIQIRTVKIGE